MNTAQGYVLLLGGNREEFNPVHDLLQQHHFPVFVACSTAQAIERMAQSSPYLMILLGSCHHWSPPLVHHLRQQVRSTEVTIVVLAELGDLDDLVASELLEDHPDLDGLLIKPLTDDVLLSVLESALVKTGILPDMLHSQLAL